MSARHQRISPTVAGIIAGVLIAVIVGVMAKINIDFQAPWAKTHTLVMRVVDADGIGVSSDVRIAGRLIGQVTAVRSAGQYAEVTFHVDDSEWPLAKDSTASIRLATLLGQKYVEIQPGSSGGVYADNDTVGLEKTRPVVDFDQILNTFDKPTRNALTSLIRTVGAGVQNQEGTLQQLLPDLRQLSGDSVKGLSTLAENDAHVNSILVNLGTLVDQLNRSRDDFAGVIDNLNQVSKSLASNQDALRGQIRNVEQLNVITDQVLGNGGAQEFNAGFQRLNGVAHQLNTLLVRIIPQSEASKGKATEAAVDLIYRIGDATSQSDSYGYFLRQAAQGVDLIGLTPNSAGTGGAGGPTAQQSAPTSPNLPIPSLPLPQLPQLPGLNGVPNGSGGNGSLLPGIRLPGGGGLLRDYWFDDGNGSASLAAFMVDLGF